jgi:hypothetical protein
LQRKEFEINKKLAKGGNARNQSTRLTRQLVETKVIPPGSTGREAAPHESADAANSYQRSIKM